MTQTRSSSRRSLPYRCRSCFGRPPFKPGGQGAKVVVTDFGLADNTSATDHTPASVLACAIRAMGGAAIAQPGCVELDFSRRFSQGRRSMHSRLDTLTNNAGTLLDRMLDRKRLISVTVGPFRESPAFRSARSRRSILGKLRISSL